MAPREEEMVIRYGVNCEVSSELWLRIDEVEGWCLRVDRLWWL